MRTSKTGKSPIYQYDENNILLQFCVIFSSGKQREVGNYKKDIIKILLFYANFSRTAYISQIKAKLLKNVVSIILVNQLKGTARCCPCGKIFRFLRKKNRFLEKFMLNFFCLLNFSGTHGFPQKMSANSVQPFGQLYS